jgi:hypothetical protein
MFAEVYSFVTAAYGCRNKSIHFDFSRIHLSILFLRSSCPHACRKGL